PPGRGGEPAAECLPPPAMPLPQPPDHSPVDEVPEMAEDVFADGMPEVVGPAAQDLVDPADHGAHVGLTNTMCQGTDLRLHRPKWTVGDERVYVPLVRASLAFPLDAETQEVESVRHMHHPRLGLRQPKPQRGQCTGDVFAQGHHVVLLA